jgi:hypothetical protein
MSPTRWINVVTGERLSEAELRTVWAMARRAYQANTHIFEDEAEALCALGVMSTAEVG